MSVPEYEEMYAACQRHVHLLHQALCPDLDVIARKSRAQISSHTKKITQHILRFGSKSLRDLWIFGFTEYDRLLYLIDGRKTDGWQGLYWMVSHEFAHVLQTEIPGGRTYRQVHNDVFEREYKRVLGQFPEEHPGVRACYMSLLEKPNTRAAAKALKLHGREALFIREGRVCHGRIVGADQGRLRLELVDESQKTHLVAEEYLTLL